VIVPSAFELGGIDQELHGLNRNIAAELATA